MERPDPTRDNPIQALLGLVVACGVLACGSLAAYRYGPRAEALAEMIDGAAATVMEVPEHSVAVASASQELLLEEPAPWPAEDGATSLEPLTNAAPRFDAAVLPATATAPLDDLESERVVAPLLAAGATSAEVTPWGSSEPRLYRVSATAPSGAPAGGFTRRYDAIGATPQEAVASVREQLRQSRLR